MKGPKDPSRELAIDVAQNIDGDWVVQTVQFQAHEADSAIGIKDLTLEQLETLAARVVNSVTVSITGEETYDDEMHLVMRHFSPETGEIYGHVKSKSGERVGIRTSYQHYYVINGFLGQKSRAMNKAYSEVHIHRNKYESGRINLQFIPI